MKKLILRIFILVGFSVQAQDSVNKTRKGYAAEGFDVVAYFDNKAIEGSKEYKTSHQGAIYLFASKTNLNKFTANPVKYLPQYGGWCAYAIGAKGDKVSIDPKTFEIRDGKLYLFYNSWGTNTLELWNKEGAEQLKKQADINWEKIKLE